MKVTLSLTHQCNLACKYCYAGSASKKGMTFETAKKIIDFAFNTTNNGYEFDVCFFGGEPFLRFNLLKEITNYVREKEAKEGKIVRLSVTTNGTILTQSMIDFLNQERIHICFSVDGIPDIHDVNRIFKNGKGSASIVYSNLRKALKHLCSVQVNAVYGPDTLGILPSSVDFLLEAGVPVIHLNPNISAYWDAETISLVQNIYAQIGKIYIQYYLNGNEISINLIDSKIVLFFKGGYTAEDMCGMGETEWGFAPSGNIYPCERFIGNDLNQSLCLGNIHTGINTKRQTLIVNKRGNRNAECQNCGYNRYCMNWCGCTNYHMTGSTEIVSSMICASERAAIQSANNVLGTLLDKKCDLFIEHFVNRFKEGRHHA